MTDCERYNFLVSIVLERDFTHEEAEFFAEHLEVCKGEHCSLEFEKQAEKDLGIPPGTYREYSGAKLRAILDIRLGRKRLEN
jgi:hypothetical protein